MKIIPIQKTRTCGVPKQKGATLLMVMLVMVLVVLTTLSTSQSSLFNESVVSNESDYSRAYLAAEALIRDAQLDISANAVQINFQGLRPNTTGEPTLAEPFFPSNAVEFDALSAALNNACVQGICAPQGVWPANALANNFWLNPTTLAVNTANAAWYGRFTGAAPGATGNPILSANPRQAWYWVEVIPFDLKGCIALQCSVVPSGPYVYRITAVARGRANTVAVIQTYFFPKSV